MLHWGFVRAQTGNLTRNLDGIKFWQWKIKTQFTKSLWIHTLKIPSIYRLREYPGDIWCGQNKIGGVRKTIVLEKKYKRNEFQVFGRVLFEWLHYTIGVVHCIVQNYIIA